MRKPVFAWLVFAICLIAATTAVGWLTHVAWRADQARQQALFDSEIRNALWRLDSLVAPLLAIEITRPSFARPVLNTPILAPHLVKGYVMQQPNGQWTIRSDSRSADTRPLPGDCPFVRTDWMPQLAATHQVWHSPPGSTRADIGTPQLLDELIIWPKSNSSESNLLFQNNVSSQDLDQTSQNRNQLVQQLSQIAANSKQLATPDAKGPRIFEPLHAIWIEQELVLARRSATGATIELCWLNWPEWERVLSAQLEGLSTKVRLVPVHPETSGTPSSWQMVSLPIRLEPQLGELAAHLPLPLLAVWILLFLVAIAFGWLMRETLNLSERRAAFVSAVTHELRTPLTTFRLYTEMLSEGITTDPDQQQVYFETLHREANRLTHLVENVLAYARLEHGRSTVRHETLTLSDLFDRCQPRLEQRVAETRLSLFIQLSETVRAATLTTNAMAVEQILFNLIDNSCKYARDATDPRILCDADLVGDSIRIRVCDFGPGLSAVARHSLFQPFQKSSAEAAETAPGVGLGLALSKRLASDLRGGLSYRANTPCGLCFELRLPLKG